jgi:microcystin-dependent protein
MSNPVEPYLGEIRIMSFGFNPQGWAECNGQLLPINQNQALFSLLGTTYGGDGRVNFALPDLRARVPLHVGNHTLGERAGEAAHTVTISELPTHTHSLVGTSSNADTPVPNNNLLGAANNLYTPIPADLTTLTTLEPTSITNIGGSQAHQNLQPFLTLNFCIALQGVFPSQN